jgi:hypothetical protein
MDLKEVLCKVVDWIRMSEEIVQRRAAVNRTVNNFLINWAIINVAKRSYYMEFICVIPQVLFLATNLLYSFSYSNLQVCFKINRVYLFDRESLPQDDRNKGILTEN